jgi:hypothetical protein
VAAARRTQVLDANTPFPFSIPPYSQGCCAEIEQKQQDCRAQKCKTVRKSEAALVLVSETALLL